MTLRELLQKNYPRHKRFKVFGTDAGLDMVLATPIHWIYNWRSDASSWEDGCWPIADVPAPYPEANTFDKRYQTSVISGDTVLVLYTVWAGVGAPPEMHVYVYARKSAVEYWPSDEQCQAAVPAWTDKLFVALQDAHNGDPSKIDLAGHWRWGKRRYGDKYNTLTEIVRHTGVDPEGRFWFLYPHDPLPEHVERWLRYVDFLVGLRAGVALEEMYPRLLAGAETTVPEGEMLDWCAACWAATLEK